MAEEIVRRLVDDLDSSTEDVERVRFGWAGVTYEVDLSRPHRQRLEEVLGPILEVARRVKQPAVPRARVRVRDRDDRDARSSAAEQRRLVREWARSAGHTVPGRGPLPLELREAYAAAHPPTAPGLEGNGPTVDPEE